MDHPPKLSPIQGIVLLFFLLVIPIGVYIFQSTDILTDFRSRAASNQSINAKLCSKIKCPAGTHVKRVSTADDAGSPNPGGAQTPERSQKYCYCEPDSFGDQTTSSLATSKKTGTGGANPQGTPTPTTTDKSITERCNTRCQSDATCGEGMVCVQTAEGGVCRNAQCYGVKDCWCYKDEAKTTVAPVCNTTCSGDTDCGPSYVCVKTTSGNKCRNPMCYTVEDCICYSTLTTPTPTGGSGPLSYDSLPDDYQGGLVPVRNSSQQYTGSTIPTIGSSSEMFLADLVTPTPNPLFFPLTTGGMILTINPFYDAKKRTNPTFMLTGTSDPNATLDITIFPDAITGTAQADVLGNWQYSVLKKLTNGDKQLTVIARSQSGGQMTKTETFSVVGAFQFPVAAIAFVLVLVGIVGGYVWYHLKKQKKNGDVQEPPLPSRYAQGSEVPKQSGS